MLKVSQLSTHRAGSGAVLSNIVATTYMWPLKSVKIFNNEAFGSSVILTTHQELTQTHGSTAYPFRVVQTQNIPIITEISVRQHLSTTQSLDS